MNEQLDLGLPADGLANPHPMQNGGDAPASLVDPRIELRRAKKRLWYQKNRESVLAQNKQWRENNPEKVKECNKSSGKKWRENNPDKRKELNKRWNADNPDKVKAWTKRWRDANKEKVRATMRTWRKANPEKVKATAKKARSRRKDKQRATYKRWVSLNAERQRKVKKAWLSANKDKVMASNKSRRARLKGAAGWDYTKAQHIAWRWDMWGGKCWLCGAEAEHTDHVIPLNVGGAHWPSNLRPACSKCNMARPKDGSDLASQKAGERAN